MVSSPSPADPPRLPRLDGLTSLRFFAALYVLFFHCGADFFVGFKMWLEFPRRAGFIAVSFFFVLSGFILTYNYVDPDRKAQRPVSRRAFWVARFSRVYPVYLLAELLMLPFMIHYAPHGRRLFTGVAHVLVLEAWFPQTAMLWNFPGWSISVEAIFYLAFPWLAAALARWLTTDREQAHENDRLWLALALLWGLALLPPTLYALLTRDAPPPLTADGLLTIDPWLYMVKFSPLPRLPEFAMGMCLGRIFQNDLRAGRRRRGPQLAVAALLVLVVGIEFHIFLPPEAVHNGLFAPLYIMLILGVAHSHRGLLHGVLTFPPLVYLGESSYSLYILHLPVALIFLFFVGDVYQLLGGITARLFLPYLALVISVSALAYRFIERPAQRLLRRLS